MNDYAELTDVDAERARVERQSRWLIAFVVVFCVTLLCVAAAATLRDP